MNTKRFLLPTILIFVLLLPSLGMFAQRTVYAAPNEYDKPAFELDKALLQHTLGDLENTLNCNATQAVFGDCFFSKTELEGYVATVLKKTKEEGASEIVEFFHSRVAEAKGFIQGFYKNLERIELIKTRQKLGATPDMKIVIAYMDVTLSDENKEPLQLMLLEWKGQYKIFSLDD